MAMIAAPDRWSRPAQEAISGTRVSNTPTRMLRLEKTRRIDPSAAPGRRSQPPKLQRPRTTTRSAAQGQSSRPIDHAITGKATSPVPTPSCQPKACRIQCDLSRSEALHRPSTIPPAITWCVFTLIQSSPSKMRTPRRIPAIQTPSPNRYPRTTGMRSFAGVGVVQSRSQSFHLAHPATW